ncbi:hypothetical protein CHH83_05465 [Bacillus sp. 7586-K]|uniref:Fluoride-specific ion channel FluC n=1 Tax=Metabacillus niabensis TaxID=324854 RepID=A0ABT9Z6L0_9BACI|nr:fluoride efflux transporter CrcB [Metabacillus niabensis]MDQ0226925.1 CrcB protein [Metabacillus niabensis]PAD70203.1 hypothetical protein CHH83_05465 [Bacillus sp. 7586-K]
MIYVALGGAIGAAMRYFISDYLGEYTKEMKLPIPTLIINWIGSLLLGVFVVFIEKDNTLLFLGTGLCGGFTTFSTFSVEVVQLLQKKNYIVSILYICITICGCVIGIYLGGLMKSF